MHVEFPVFIYLPDPGTGPVTCQLYWTRAGLRRAMGHPWWAGVDPLDIPRVFMITADHDDLFITRLTPPY